MGTRADFYVGRGESAEWLGSIAWDGNPSGIPSVIRIANREDEYRAGVADFLSGREDATKPENGWPWPWDDGQLTDYSYAFDEGRVWATNYGYGWFKAAEPEPDVVENENTPKVAFPNMKERKNVTYGKRSGVTIISR